MLEVFGLAPEIEQVYELLLNARPTTARELAAATGLAHPVVRSALRELQDLGLVDRTAGKPSGYSAVDPCLTLDALLLAQEERLRRARVHAGEVSERFRHAVGRDPAEMVEVLTGSEMIVERHHQLERSARRELRYFDKPPYRAGYAFSNEPELELLRAGGGARCIYETAAVDLPGRLPALDTFVAAGEQARVLPSLPTKMVLVDDRAGIVPLRITGDVPSGSYLVVHRSALLDALCGLFETLWDLALPLTLGAVARGEDGPDALERQVLGLMNAGLPDEAIARHLGLSHRTLQRRIRDLMDRLDVHTRYQLGAQAAVRKWALPAGRERGEQPAER